MNLQINDVYIPGTVLRRDTMGNVTGMEFLKKIFYIQDGIMLSQIREISGIDGSTLQNWTKRGWVANAKLKKYDIDQLAHISTGAFTTVRTISSAIRGFTTTSAAYSTSL